jgi:hypothetical protein
MIGHKVLRRTILLLGHKLVKYIDLVCSHAFTYLILEVLVSSLRVVTTSCVDVNIRLYS